MYVYKKPHTLIKGGTLVSNTFASWKNSEVYGNKFLKRLCV